MRQAGRMVTVAQTRSMAATKNDNRQSKCGFTLAFSTLVIFSVVSRIFRTFDQATASVCRMQSCYDSSDLGTRRAASPR
jgi:uncharacterized membrane protein